MIALTKNRNERPTWPWQAAAATLQLLFGAGKVLAGALAGCFFALLLEALRWRRAAAWGVFLAAALGRCYSDRRALLLGAAAWSLYPFWLARCLRPGGSLALALLLLSGWRAACGLAALWRLHCCFFLAGGLPEAWRLLWLLVRCCLRPARRCFVSWNIFLGNQMG